MNAAAQSRVANPISAVCWAVYYGGRWQVDAEVRDPRAWVDETRYQDVLAAYGRQHGWIVVDPLPAIRAATSINDKSLFLDVGHPDEAGQRILAQELYSALSQGGLLP